MDNFRCLSGSPRWPHSCLLLLIVVVLRRRSGARKKKPAAAAARDAGRSSQRSR